MTISRKVLSLVYGLIGLVALVGTWTNGLPYLQDGLVGGNVRFWQETLVSPASRFITVDVLFLSLAVTVWMVLEARRLAMRGVWLYVIFGFLIAVSFTVPAFLIHRERTLARREDSSGAGSLRAGDIAGLGLLAIAFLAYTALALHR